MPRDGSNIYHRPPGTDGVPNYTVESARYNAFTADVEQDLNLPRPVIAGGTGANNAADAMTNLGGELSAQLISNYNSDPFQAGSFYSAAGATGAPSVNAFTGICYSAVITGSVTTDLFIEARDQTTTNMWVRQKKANVWQPWVQAAGVTTGPSVPTSVSPNTLWWDPTRGKLFIYYQDADSSQWVEAVAVPDVDVNTFVEIAGDTMNGPLILSADPTAPLGAVTKQYADANLGAVRYDAAQPLLTAPQQKQARQNINTDSGVFSADRNGVDQTGLTPSTPNKIAFNNEVKDANSWYDPATFRYTPQIAGTYFIQVYATANCGNSGETPEALIYKNGVMVRSGSYLVASALGANLFISSVTGLIQMNGTTDFIEAWIYMPSIRTVLSGIVANTNFGGYRVGD